DGLRDFVPEGARSFARTVLRSSAKALIVTETVWPEEVAKLHDQALGYATFPAAARFTRRTGSFELDGAERWRHVDVKAIHAYDASGTLLGSILSTVTGEGDAA